MQIRMDETGLADSVELETGKEQEACWSLVANEGTTVIIQDADRESTITLVYGQGADSVDAIAILVDMEGTFKRATGSGSSVEEAYNAALENLLY